MVKIATSLVLIALIAQPAKVVAQNADIAGVDERDAAFTNHRQIPCATLDPTVDQIIQSKTEVDDWLLQNNTRDRDQVIIYVVWHAIHASDNTGIFLKLESLVR